jgi:hypothetical protein
MKATASDQKCLGEEALRSAISKFPYLEQTSNLKISTGTCSIFFSSLQTSTSALERYQERVPHFPVRRYKALQQVPKGVWENSHIHSRFYSTAWHPLCTMIHRSSSTVAISSNPSKPSLHPPGSVRQGTSVSESPLRDHSAFDPTHNPSTPGSSK